MPDEQAREIEELTRIFQLQKASASPSNAPSYEQRLDRLSRVDRLCRDNERDFRSAGKRLREQEPGHDVSGGHLPAARPRQARAAARRRVEERPRVVLIGTTASSVA